VIRRGFAALAVAGAACLALGSGALAADDDYVGTWPGTWQDGQGGGGKFDLTFEKGADGKLAGSVAVDGDPQGPYAAKMTAVAFEGAKLTAKYPYPNIPGSEITLTGDFSGAAANGAWNLGAEGQSVATGGWKVAKK
jgi:hypothetical protein